MTLKYFSFKEKTKKTIGLLGEDLDPEQRNRIRLKIKGNKK